MHGCLLAAREFVLHTGNYVNETFYFQAVGRHPLLQSFFHDLVKDMLDCHALSGVQVAHDSIRSTAVTARSRRGQHHWCVVGPDLSTLITDALCAGFATTGLKGSGNVTILEATMQHLFALLSKEKDRVFALDLIGMFCGFILRQI